MNSKSHYVDPIPCTNDVAKHPARATDIIEATVLAHDRQANVIILKDNTVWPLELLTECLPDNIRAGDAVQIRYEFNEDDGLQSIHSIIRIEP